ncbi:hypothetical protein MYX78_06495 [Acidobacteria bacterium AH-259-G07]|nr:hypothetical protein [Acidobacteria bacterium AH-259-G07]
MVFTTLEVIDGQISKFTATKPTAQQGCQDRSVAPAFEKRVLQSSSCLS